MEIKVKKLDPRAVVPQHASPDSAGADLYALSDAPVTIMPHATEFIHTGLSIETPKGYVSLVFARSGLAAKGGLAPANKVGVIDADYRGEIMVALHNHSDVPVTVTDGQRVAQLVIVPVLGTSFVESDELTATERGAGGFGSTGK